MVLVCVVIIDEDTRKIVPQEEFVLERNTDDLHKIRIIRESRSAFCGAGGAFVTPEHNHLSVSLEQFDHTVHDHLTAEIVIGRGEAEITFLSSREAESME